MKTVLSTYTCFFHQRKWAFSKIPQDGKKKNLYATVKTLQDLFDKTMGCIQSNGKLLMGFQQRDDMIGFES